MVLLLAAVSQLKMDPCDLATKWCVDVSYYIAAVSMLFSIVPKYLD